MMKPIETLQQYASLTQGRSAHDKDIETVAAIVSDICQRIEQVPDVSHVEPSFFVVTGGQ